MAVAFRATSVFTKGTAANMTMTEPAGTAQDDILVAFIHIENETPPAVTGPSGWANTFNATTMLATCSTVGQKMKTYMWWIRRGVSAPALTWTFTSSFRAGFIVGYSGALASGDPWSFGNTAVRDDSTAATFPAVSGTTSDANEMLVWVGSTWQGGTAGTPPTSFTERLDCIAGNQSTYDFAELVQAGAGTTGSITGGNYTGTNGVVTSQVGGLRPAAAVASLYRINRMLTGIGS